MPESVAVRVTGETFQSPAGAHRRSILRDESRRTRFERALPDLGVAGGCKKDDAAVQHRGFELPAGVEAAHVGEIQVHHDDVRVQSSGRVEQLRASGHGADDVDEDEMRRAKAVRILA